MPPRSKLRELRIVASDRAGLERAIVDCWSALRVMGYSRRVLGAAFVAAWARGNIRIERGAP